MTATKAASAKAPAKPTSGKAGGSKGAPAAGTGVVGWIVGPGRSLTILLVLTAGAATAITVKWPAIKALVHGHRDLWLTPDGIEIKPAPPPWIHSDIRAEVVRDATLNGAVSLVDPQLVERVRDAFALHSWVAEVVRVTKHHPARVVVEIKYRRPVAMVEVPGGLYPIDGEGRLLPSADFSSQEALKYPRVVKISTSAGPVGTHWGDSRVEGAGRIAAALIDDWTLLGLYSIAPPVSEQDGFVLLTPRGTRVLWGSPPGMTAPINEAATLEKVARLKKLAIERGSLDGPAGAQDIDVRPLAEPLIAPRTVDERNSTLGR